MGFDDATEVHRKSGTAVVAGDALLQMEQIALHSGREIRINDRSRCPLILAELRQNAVRGGDG